MTMRSPDTLHVCALGRVRYRDGLRLMDELKDLHEKVSQNDKIQEFNKSRSDLTTLLVATDDLISEKIGRRFAIKTGGSCCG